MPSRDHKTLWFSPLLLCLVFFTPGLGSAAAQRTTSSEGCPGLSGGVCGPECQLHICSSLAAFYKVTLNTSDPWDNEDGWELTTRIPCERLVAGGGPWEAIYCSWFGITCCTPSAVAQDNCTAVNTITSIQMPVNNLNASVGNVNVVKPVQQIHDCGLTVLDLEGNNLAGQLSEAWGRLVNLKVFNLGDCWIAGRIPDSLRNLRNLTILNLSNNWLNGTLPSWLDDLEQLQVLNLGSEFGANEGTDGVVGLMGTVPVQISNLQQLRELNLETNALTGVLPANLCAGDTSSLLVLNVRGNNLEGDASVVESCGNLVQLDISHNKFTGALPASADWDELATYRANNNRFSGSIPVKLTRRSRILEYLDLSNNQLSGQIPKQIVLLSFLKSLDISSNQFTGALNENIWYLPALMVIDISNNDFVGIISSAIGLAYSLQSVDFSNNARLTGVIPPELGILESLEIVRTQNTSMSCSGIIKPYVVTTNASCSDPARCTTPTVHGSHATSAHICTQHEQLPCFLRFSDYLVPREDASNMRCRYIMRLPKDKAVKVCEENHQTVDLGGQAGLLPDIAADTQSWYVDPAYYQYQACECLMGYTEVWDEHHTVLTCVLAETPGLSGKRTAIVVGSVAAALVLLLLGLVWRQYLTTRPRWLRERIMQAKRTKGAPKCSKPGDKVNVSIVVTDVKDFSKLTRSCPELMNKAMGGHNNILRKACHAHAGYVMDQEGDSWTVAFHDAEDAVAFSLQVQQALAQKVWGMRLSSSAAALADLNVVASLRDEIGFSSRYSARLEGASAASTPHRLHTRENSVEGQQAATTAAGANGQQGAAGEAAVDISRAGPSFTGYSSRASSHSASFSQLVQPSNSAELATNRKAVLGMWLGKLGNSSSSDVLQRPEGQLSFSDTNGACDNDTTQQNDVLPPGQQLQLQQHLAAAAVMGSGGSWESAQLQQQLVATAASKSSFGSALDAVGSGSASGTGGSTTQQLPSEDRKSSKMWFTGSALVRRWSHFRSGASYGKQGRLSGEQQQEKMQVLRLQVRIGVATGPLPYHCQVSNCAVKDRAKDLVSDVANGGQVLLDEATFLVIKDSLSVLGTINESGYDDQMLQQLMHAQVVHKLQRPFACDPCIRPGKREASFTSDVDREPHDYDNDAIVVHMGCFEVPGLPLTEVATESKNIADPLHASSGSPAGHLDQEVEGNATTGQHAGMKDGGQQKLSKQQLQLYSIAAPGMRRQGQVEDTQEFARYLRWTDPVHMKTGWVQVQKGYFDAPGARQMGLAPVSSVYSHAYDHDQAAMPDVTIVFASVANSGSFTYKRSRSDTCYINKVIRRCMLQQLAALPSGDGYLCRCQEGELKYMIAFEQPHKAVQWCLAVQEALMYVNWPASVLAHPGFGEVLNPETGLPIFRGPRLRMGLAEGQPDSVLPDHNGHANYFGGSVNRAARYMDTVAHGGQIVTDLELLYKLNAVWAAQDRDEDQADTTADDSIQDVPSLSGAEDTQQQQPQQRRQQMPQRCQLQLPPPAPSSVAGSEVGLLPMLRSARRKQHLSDNLGEQEAYLELAHRSRSESYARRGERVTFNLSRPPLPHHLLHQQHQRGPGLGAGHLQVRSSGRSFTNGMPGDLQSPFAVPLSAGQAGSGLANLPEACLGAAASRALLPAAHYEAVTAWHVGTFSFKGSGEYEMAHVLHAALASRTFPDEAPRGKGQRLVEKCCLVEGLEKVQLHIQQPLLAARHAFVACQLPS